MRNALFGTPGELKETFQRRDGTLQEFFWPSIPEQVLDARDEIQPEWFTVKHQPMDLWTYAEDCPHSNPELDPRFDGVEDRIDEWLDRNCPGLRLGDSWKFGRLHWINRERAIANVPLATEYELAMAEYEAAHDSGVCMLSYQGTCCTGCTEGDDDFGYEPASCNLTEDVREALNDFLDELSFFKKAV